MNLKSFWLHLLVACSGLFTPQDLRAEKCDYLIITDSMFTRQANRLAELRHRLTPKVAIAPCISQMEDIYRDYPPIGPKWKSLRDYLKTTYALNKPDLAHVVLLGDASLDAASPRNHIPTFTEQIRSLDRYSSDPEIVFYDTVTSDDFYATFVDSLHAGSTPAMAFGIGRVPADSPQQADAYLDKLEAYESNYAYGPDAFTYGFLNDDDLQKGSGNDLDPIDNMPQLHEEIWKGLPIKPFVRRMLSIEFPIQPDGQKPEAHDSTLGLFNKAPARIYFIGHGSPYQLTDEKIFNVPADLTRLQTKKLQPIASMLACTTARFAHADSNSMGEELLFHPNGVIAFLGGTIPTYPSPNNRLFERWNTLALAGGTLGSTFAKAKDKDSLGYERINSLAYAVLGDPALSLPTPEFDLVPAPGSNVTKLNLVNAGSLGDSAYFQLVRIDSMPYNAVINPLSLRFIDAQYPREVVVAEGRASLTSSGNVSFSLPWTQDPRAMAIKVMTWNSSGMHYGHFPLESLGVMALQPMRKPIAGLAGWHVVLKGNRLVLVGKGRNIGLDGKTLR